MAFAILSYPVDEAGTHSYSISGEVPMATLPEQIVELLKNSPGLTDREITNRLRSSSDAQQPINIAARKLAQKEIVLRKRRHDGLIGNYLTGKEHKPTATLSPKSPPSEENNLTEDQAKEILKSWLEQSGWVARVAWGRTPGIDIDAYRDEERWVIEVKGIGSRPQMRVNYFISMLGETLQRMDDPDAKYSIAIPDVQQFRNLWYRLPNLAKERTSITALFVTGNGNVSEVGLE